ncbi:MAG: Rrf2 family transcriptional regulator [bacterium]|nr:Rrf2 family transcriptional regulator [bacterium]
MISRTGLHAVRALAELARLPAGHYAGAGAVAGRIGAPANYLGKLLQDLTRVGLVESQKGLGGGFRLARDPRRITLYDIADPIDHVSRWGGCFMGQGACSDDAPCPVHRRWARVREAYLTMLKKTTVADLVGGRGAAAVRGLAGTGKT